MINLTKIETLEEILLNFKKIEARETKIFFIVVIKYFVNIKFCQINYLTI